MIILPPFLVKRLVFKQTKEICSICSIYPLSLSSFAAYALAANNTIGIKHVHTTLATLWKYFHTPKRGESLKEIQKVRSSSYLTLVDLHMSSQCIKAVKISLTVFNVTLESNYQNFHAPEALGLHKALSMFITIAAIYLLDYTLPLVAKLSICLQTKQLEIFHDLFSRRCNSPL